MNEICGMVGVLLVGLLKQKVGKQHTTQFCLLTSPTYLRCYGLAF